MLGIPFLESIIWKWFTPQLSDDACDRLNYFVTSFMLSFFSFMVSAKQYVGSPIQCWVPMEFKGGWEQYAEDYCFIQNTYFTSFTDDIPDSTAEREKAEIGYYQWVPIVLALQAIMFYLPNFIWKTLHQQSGIDISSAITDSRKASGMYGSERKKSIGAVVTYLEECLEMYPSNDPDRVLFYRSGSYISVLFIFVKFLYVLNVFSQLYIMNHFLGTGYTFWGWDTFNDLLNGREWHESGVFPRVTMCDFTIRRLANHHRFTIQCVLMINMFNEKIYIFLWFWMLFLAVVTLTNFFYSMVRLLFPIFRVKSCRKWLSFRGDSHINREESVLLREFVMDQLKPDGILLMRLIQGHAGSIVARDVVKELFVNFAQRRTVQEETLSMKQGMYPSSETKKMDYSMEPTMMMA